jgi:hypothetical protein
MKKLYFLDEEEKNRILNIHESATKHQYLSEQTSPFGTIPNNPLGNNVPTNNKTKSLGPVKTTEVGPKTEGVAKDVNWSGIYACVPKKTGAVATKLKDGSTCYVINNVIYYNNGFKRKKPIANNKSEPYTCNDPEFKTGVSIENKAKKLQQYKQQIVAKTTENTKAIQKLLGLPETGNMDSALLQKINDKLNGKPQEAPKSGVTTPPAAAAGTTTPTTTPTTGTPAAGIAQAQQQVGMTSDQLNDAIKQLQANANRPR